MTEQELNHHLETWSPTSRMIIKTLAQIVSAIGGSLGCYGLLLRFHFPSVEAVNYAMYVVISLISSLSTAFILFLAFLLR